MSKTIQPKEIAFKMNTYDLPEQFVSSVKVIFDVLDQRKVGCIWVNDLESKWNNENTSNLPVDVIESLRAIAPPNGRLDFHLFLEGLRRSLFLSKQHQQNGAVFPAHTTDVSSTPPKPIKPFSLQNRSQSSPFIQIQPRTTAMQGLKNSSLSQENLSRSTHYSGLNTNDHQLSPQAAAEHKQESEFYKRQVPRRRDSTRRHTLGHGVDDSMLRRSRLLEDERRMLLRGLQAVDKAKHWYTKRLGEVAEKQRYGAPETTDQSTDQQIERINFEKLRITELSQQIDALTEPSPNGGLMRMNLVRPSQTRQQTIPYEITEQQQQHQQDSQHAMQLVRAQNKMLTKEVTQKSERIAQLEKEKAALLKDLFESRANQRVQQRKSIGPPGRANYEESTLM